MPLFDEVRFFNERSLIFNKKFTSFPVRVTNATLRAENNASGFAILKGKEWQYPLQKLFCIIGRSPINYNQPNVSLPVVWHVDIDLGHIKKVSRQHALIIYNFEDEFWEIKCLSNKYPLYINKKKITQNMKAEKLESGMIVTIGSESFFWLEAREDNQEI